MVLIDQMLGLWHPAGMQETGSIHSVFTTARVFQKYDHQIYLKILSNSEGNVFFSSHHDQLCSVLLCI